MKKTTDKFDTSTASVLVDELEKSLNEQIKLNRQFMVDKAMEKANSCASLMATIKKEKVLDMPEFSAKKKTIKRLYKDLELVITANHQEVAIKLEQIRNAKKALSAYSKNI